MSHTDLDSQVLESFLVDMGPSYREFEYGHQRLCTATPGELNPEGDSTLIDTNLRS
jgi:hypothetical protein